MQFRTTATVLLLVLAAACSAEENAGKEGPDGTVAEADGGSAAPPLPKPIEGTPKVDELTEAFGVFVAPHGVAGNDGSRSKPLPSLAAARELAKAKSKRIYVCQGSFKEAIVIERGIPMIGGLDCTAPIWKQTGARTRIEAPSSPAITAYDVDVPTRIEGFDVYAPDGTNAKPSSSGV